MLRLLCSASLVFLLAACQPAPMPGTPALPASPESSASPVATPAPTASPAAPASPRFGLDTHLTRTLAGGNGDVGFRDGQGRDAVFYNPSSLVLEPNGDLLVLDRFNHRIRRVTPAGAVSTYWGTGERGNRDGANGTGLLNQPITLLREADGSLLIADTQNHSIRRLSPDGVLSTVAGNGGPGFQDGPARSAAFNWPGDLAKDAAGNIYVADRDNHSIRKITPEGQVSTLAGDGSPGMNNGQGTAARFNGPMGLISGPDGLLYVADTGNSLIRSVSLTGEVLSFAGSGVAGQREGTRETAQFQNPTGLAFDSDNNLFVLDRHNHRLQVVTLAGEVITVAGAGAEPTLRDGSGSESAFAYPYDLVVTPDNVLYIADYSNHAIREVRRR